MISFAPNPVEDELLYGYAGRWFELSGYVDFADFFTVAFGVHADLLFVGNPLPNGLYSSCGVIASDQEVIARHTILPFLNFVSLRVPEGSEKILKNGIEPLRSGFRGEHFSELRYCKECAKLQLKDLGFSTWMRAPNLPGVVACWLHGSSLSSVRVKAFARPKMVPLTHHSTSLTTVIDGEIWYAAAARQLLFVHQEAPISQIQLRKALRDACGRSFNTKFGILTQACKALVSQRMSTINWVRLVRNLHHCKALESHRVITDCLKESRAIDSGLALLLALLAQDGDFDGFFHQAVRIKDVDDLNAMEAVAAGNRGAYEKYCAGVRTARHIQAQGDKLFGKAEVLSVHDHQR